MRVRLVQQMSGGRPDGTPWPPPGSILEVSDAEGAELCRSDDHSSHPIAVPVVEEKRAETPEDKLPAPEKRAEPEVAAAEAPAEAEAEAPEAEAAPEEVASAEAPARRGPGRPRKAE